MGCSLAQPWQKRLASAKMPTTGSIALRSSLSLGSMKLVQARHSPAEAPGR